MDNIEYFIDVVRTTLISALNDFPNTKFYIFGSLINNDGQQFLDDSDIDILLVIPDDCNDALHRVEFLTKLVDIKKTIESRLLVALRRVDASIPICSFLAVTKFELASEIHKTVPSGFYSTNEFWDIESKKKSSPLLLNKNTRICRIPDEATHIFQTVQKYRNEFLSYSPNHLNKKMVEYHNEPLPKQIMRIAAMTSALVNEITSPSDRFNTDEGLQFITEILRSGRNTDPRIRDISQKLSVRRGGRGVKQDFSSEEILLMAELLIDRARNAITLSVDEEDVIVQYDNSSANITRINGYKLFYFRFEAAISIAQLSTQTGIPMRRLRYFERMHRPLKHRQSVFVKCADSEIQLLENVLGQHTQLKAGTDSDFLSQIMFFYERHRPLKSKSSESMQGVFKYPTKVVIFDFDGTLTNKSKNGHTTWESIWLSLGYSLKDCAKYFVQFRNKIIDHQKWCDITNKFFVEKSLSRRLLSEIASEITLVDGVDETLVELERREIKMYILSGSIREVILDVIGHRIKYFERVQANRMHFDANGMLKRIEGTRYDFEGKADFILDVCKNEGCGESEVLFVGNSINDTWAIKSGARTICVNPNMTDPFNTSIWTACITRMDSITEILEYIPD